MAKLNLGRKFWGAMILTIAIIIIYFGTLIFRKEAITPIVTQMAIGSVAFAWIIYSSTNVAVKLIKGKFFKQEILDDEDK